MLNDPKNAIESHTHQHTLLYLVLSHPVVKSAEISKITVRPVVSKGQACYQWTNHYAQKVTHQNLAAAELLPKVWALLANDYRAAHFFTVDADYQLLISKSKQWTFLTKKPSRQLTDLSHNRSKVYLLKEGSAIPFLITLGIMRNDGSVVPKMAHKFKQINRFVEMIADVMNHFPKDKALNIIDFGCGKSYLTFALYHYLTVIKQIKCTILGLDLKADVVQHCQQLALDLGYKGLSFKVGDINTHQTQVSVDLVVSLHACDTATDAALEKAINWEAEIILCVPCCQHEVFNQIKNDALSPLLKHGILKERLAALVTDAARAQLLESCGYRTQVMEFIDMEHTPKNLLIRAVRSNRTVNRANVLNEYYAFTQSLSICPSLEKRLLK